jgi:DNA helicase II / ATP-dependent DNA helicase PcrA
LCQFSDIAVLYRFHTLGKQVADELTAAGIPFQVLERKHFFEYEPMAGIIAFMRLVHNPFDTACLDSAVEVTRLQIHKTTRNLVKSLIQQRQLTCPDAFGIILGERQLKGNSLQAVTDFITVYQDMRDGLTRMTLSGWVTDLLARISLTVDNEQIPFREFQQMLARFGETRARESLAVFLEDINTLKTNDLYNPLARSVSLMSMHAAKGLEFRCVFIIGVEEGLLPFTLMNNADIEEERRLLYVGITRAKEMLYLFHARERFIYGEKRGEQPSTFLTELPAENLQGSMDEQFFAAMNRRPFEPTDRQLSFDL